MNQIKIKINKLIQIKVPAVPLQQLLPRIFCLSKPKLVTPKFVKPIEIPFELAGEIKDWKAHRKWLEKKAKPKKDHSREAFEVKKLHVQSRCGMIKIKQLAAPKIDLHNKHHRPKTYRKVRRFGLGPSMRIIELSVPKLRVDIKTDYRPLENSLRISKSALAYQRNYKHFIF